MIRFLLFLVVYGNCLSQDFELQWEYMESQGLEFSTDELLETWDYYQRNPIDLNSQEDLNKLTELQLLTYNEFSLLKNFCKSKILYSKYQLQQSNLSIHTLKRIRPFVTSYLDVKSNLSKTEYYIGIQKQVDNSDRTNEQFLLGSIYKTQIKYKHSPNNKWNYAINWEKDAGEPMWYKGNGPNNLSFTSKYKLKMGSIIIGKYNLSIGEGLLIGHNFRINNPYFLNYQPTHTSTPCSSSKEYNYFQGISYQRNNRNYIYNIFLSLKKLSGENNIDNSGLFRTKSELKKRNLNSESLVGLQLQKKSLKSVFNFSTMLYKSKLYSAEIVYLQSLYFNYNYYNLSYSTEIINENYAKWAQIQKLNIAIGKKTLLTIQYRNRQQEIFNYYQSDYSAYSNAYEKGFYWALQNQFRKGFTFKIAFDDFNSNANYLNYPYYNKGQAFFVEVSKIKNDNTYYIRYHYQHKTNLIVKHKIKLMYQHTISENIRMKTKLLISRIEEKTNSSLQLNINWKSTNKKHSLNTSYNTFNSTTEAIYWSAPYFYGHYNSKFISGNSQVFSIGYQSKLTKQLKSGIEYIYTSQPEKKISKLSLYIKWTQKD